MESKKEIDSLNDDFIRLKKIGQGGFGKVYKVQEKKTGNIYAAKCFDISLDECPGEILDDLSREINILSKIKHKSIIEFKCFSITDFNNDKCPVIITEYMEKGSLSTILNQIRNSIPISGWNITRKLINIYGIACSMSYLHSHNIIHRDLKPDNILMDNFLYPKVADFGLSKMIHSEKSETASKSNALKGTIPYIAPEIFIEFDYTSKCDVYSYGIIVYEIMTDLIPYKDKNQFLIINYVSKGNRPPLNNSIPTSYRNLIERCWSQEPQDRPTFDEILTLLKNDRGFITSEVDENEYRNYVDYIDHQPKNFEPDRQVFNINQIRPKTIKYPIDKLELLSEECSELVRQAADDIEMQFYVGRNLIEGANDFPKDEELGIKYLEKSIENGLIESAIYYSSLLISGKIIKRDLKKAKAILEKFLKSQNAIVLLLYGKIMKKEHLYAAAKCYFEKSSDAGNPEANYELGKLYYNGVCCTKNKVKANKYFTTAKVNGFNKSDQFLAKQRKISEDLSNIPKNEKAKFNHFKQLADKKVIDAMYQCGLMLLNGQGVEKNEEEALRYFKMAVERGHNESMIECGFILKEHDKKESIRYFEKAAKEGNPEGMAEYGRILFYGDGVPTDKHIALRYIKRGAENKNPKALNIYAMILQNGDGVKADEHEAEKYFKMAIDAGNKDAIYNYAMMLLHTKEDLYGKKQIADYFKMAIDNGNPDAMYTYATMLSNGERVPVDKKEAARYFKMAVDNGNSDAMFEYAMILLNGNGIQKNETEAFRYFKLSAAKGNLHAMFNLAMMILNEKGAKTNKNEAAQYFKHLADKGNSYAMCNYATMLFNGDGIPKNTGEAAKYYKIAIENGNSDAMYNYAMMLLNENENQKSKDEAICYIKMSIKRGNIKAITKYAEMFIIGDHHCRDVFDLLMILIEKGNTRAMLAYSSILFFGIGIESNPSKAVQYIKKAIEKGDSTAMLNYSTLLLYGEGVSISKKVAFRYLKMSIDKGNPDAIFRYGKMLLNGENVPVNKKEAFRYLKMAIEKGNSDAMLYYSKIDANFDIVQPDMNKAAPYIKMAINKGNSDAMFQYAKMLLNGNGVSVNKSEALRYFKMAINKGNSDAMFEYARMLLNGDEVPVDKNEALRYFKMAIDKGNSNAMFQYAKMLLNGDGVKINKSAAYHYFKIASDKGNSDAMFEYAKMLLNGEVVSADKGEALRCFKILADKGNSSAMFQYAKIILHNSLQEFEAIHYLKMSGYNLFVEESDQSIKYVSEKEELMQKIQKKELDEYKKELNEGYTQSIIVSGIDCYNVLNEKPNNTDSKNKPIISPPVKLSFDPSSLLSYSVYYNHSVLVMSDGSLKGVGYNNDGRISATLQRTLINEFTDFSIKDGRGYRLSAVSAVCYEYGTLYMLSKGSEMKLVLCDCSINGGNPIFLDIGNHHPVALFGGHIHSAAICSEGEFIFISRNSVCNYPNSHIAAVSLPNGEKASSIACCDDSIIVLSLNGRVFSSPIETGGVLKFSIVSELSDQEIVCISGTRDHCFAVSKEGYVFGRGSNDYGKLGMGKNFIYKPRKLSLEKGLMNYSSFTVISSLLEYEIKAAYAGFDHSLFETCEGKVISLGCNYYGQLLSNGTSGIVFIPAITTITIGASFCIAGCNLSAVFIGSCPPKKTPNIKIVEYK